MNMKNQGTYRMYLSWKPLWVRKTLPRVELETVESDDQKMEDALKHDDLTLLILTCTRYVLIFIEIVS